MKSRTTRGFWVQFDALPLSEQRRAVRAYAVWRETPGHPSLQFKCVSERHAVYSVRIGLRWRALAYRESGGGEDVLTWFWVGSHADYDQLLSTL